MLLVLVLAFSSCALAQTGAGQTSAGQTVSAPGSSTPIRVAVYQAPTQLDRVQWATVATVGSPSLIAGAITSAISTGLNRPAEYGPHWDGYFKRQGLRLTGAVASNFMEAELGALWGEDPRYRRAGNGSGGHRLWHAVKTSVIAYDRHGDPMPAYARLIAIPASNVIANSWRPDSQHTAARTGERVMLGFVSRIAANTFVEFWPDIRAKLGRR